VWALACLYFGAANPRTLLLSDEGFYARQWIWSSTPMFIPYRDVTSSQEKAYRRRGSTGKVRMLYIRYPGSVLRLNMLWFESEYLFDEFSAEFNARRQLARVAFIPVPNAPQAARAAQPNVRRG
jgi:hypothetical protein